MRRIQNANQRKAEKKEDFNFTFNKLGGSAVY